MTTRKEKRIRWNKLITSLEVLETKHYEIDEQLSCFSSTCEICVKIRAIGDALTAGSEVENERRSYTTRSGFTKHPHTSLNGLLTVNQYWKYKAKHVSDSEICKKKNVSTKTMSNWKRDNNIKYQMSMKGVKKK